MSARLPFDKCSVLLSHARSACMNRHVRHSPNTLFFSHKSVLGGRSFSRPLVGTPRQDAIVIGCVKYCETVGSIWDGMVRRFESRGVGLDFVLFNSYERQVEALLNGHIEVAWNGPLAHVRTQRRTNGTSISLGMRDGDRGFVSQIVALTDSGIKSIGDLAGRKLSAGTFDSPQAYILPLHYLSQQIPLKNLDITRYDRDVGKHGDTAVGEVEVIKALAEGRAEAGVVSKMMLDRAFAAGTIDPRKLRTVAHVPPFDHCQFDALGTMSTSRREAFSSALFAMNFSDEADRPVMQAEGISKKWEGPREEGYATMRDAMRDEPVVPFPPPAHTAVLHPFKSLTVA